MSTTSQRPRTVPPSRARSRQLDYTQILRPTIQYELYNGGDEPVNFAWGAMTYTIPAADEFWDGKDPQTGEAIRYNRPGIRPIWGRPEAGITAKDIIEAAVGPDGRSGQVGVVGVRALFGDERDELVMMEAQEAWSAKAFLDTQQIIRDHEIAVDKARAESRPIPRPKDAVVEAYARRARMEKVDVFKFSCEVCGAGFTQEYEVWTHVTTIHTDKPQALAAAQEKIAAILPPVEKAPAPDLHRKARAIVPPPPPPQPPPVQASPEIPEEDEDDDGNGDEEDMPVGSDGEGTTNEGGQPEPLKTAASEPPPAPPRRGAPLFRKKGEYPPEQ